MLGQGHKITMSRWPNCPNMCGARIPLKLEVKEVKVK